MPKAVPPPPSPTIDFEKIRFRMNIAIRADVAKALGLKALPDAAATEIEQAVLAFRAMAQDTTTPGKSIAAIDDALKLKKKFARAMRQFADPKSGVDVVTCGMLGFYANQCLRAYEAFAVAAEGQRKQLHGVRHMDMAKERRKLFCAQLRLVFEEHADLPHRQGPQDDVRRHKREFALAVAAAADVDLKVDADAHPERLDALIAISPADIFAG